MLRRKALIMLASLPFLDFLKRPRPAQVVIPETAKDRIAEVLAKGGKVASITYYLEPDERGGWGGGTLFFTTPEESDWQVR